MTKKSDELLRLERDLNERPELKEKLDAEIRRIAGAGEAQSDGEATVKAAAALGYTITAEELERAAAEMETLDDDELDAAGGLNTDLYYKDKVIDECVKNNKCAKFWNNQNEDEKGHDIWCLTAWHCLSATLHSATDSQRVACWKDHACVLVSGSDPDNRS